MRMLVVTFPSVTACPTVMPSPLSIIVPLEYIHTTSGEEKRFSALVTLQISVCSIPAVEGPSGVISTCGVGRSVQEMEIKSHKA